MPVATKNNNVKHEPVVDPVQQVIQELYSERVVYEEGAIRRTSTIPRIPIPIPWPFVFGSRCIIWKQDPSVGALGRRTIFIPGLVLDGPRDARINTQLNGTTPVVRNANGDFIFKANTPEGDCVHTFAVVRQTLTMFERILEGQKIPWAWNNGGNTDVLTIHPRAGVTPNAFYSRNQKALKFFYFTPSGAANPVFTCRSLDIAAHETGHAILDGLKPGWLGFGNPPQTGGLHESFGDLTAIFLALSQLDQVEAFVAMTKANLHAKNFLAALAEQFGAALGRPMGLRNADNDLKLSEVSNEVHAISQVFTGAIYDILADIFAYEKNKQMSTKDPAQVLLEVSQHLSKLWLNAIIKSPDVAATYSDVANQMLKISHSQGDPIVYRTFIRNRFKVRDILVSATPITMAMLSELPDDPDFSYDDDDSLELETALPEHPSLIAHQDRSGCCGTMQLPEYTLSEDRLNSNLRRLGGEVGELIPDDDLLADELDELQKLFK